MHFADAFGLVFTSSVEANHAHAKCGAQLCGLRANAAHADNERGGLRQVDDARVKLRWLPLMPQLLRNVVVESASERQHKRHDVRGYVLVENAAEIRHNHRMGNELWKIVASRRRNCWRLQPPQLVGPGEQVC